MDTDTQTNRNLDNQSDAVDADIDRQTAVIDQEIDRELNDQSDEPNPLSDDSVVQPEMPATPARRGLREKINAAGEYLRTPDYTIDTFTQDASESDLKIAESLETAKAEIAEYPRRAKKVLEEMDADALLLKKILEQRSGLRGIINRFDEWFSIKEFRLSGIATSGAGAVLADKILLAYKFSNPLAGGLIGGVAGGFWGYIRGRNKQESAKSWLGSVDLKNSGQADLEKMDPAELDIAIGVIRNAVSKDKVRGNREELLQLMRTYRTMKEVRAKKLKNETERDPFKDVIDSQKTEDEIGELLTAKAGEKYQDLYKKINSGKGRQILASALKGAAVGASLGALFNVLLAKFATGGAHGQGTHLNQAENAARTLHNQNVDVANNLPIHPDFKLPDGMTQVQANDIMQHFANLRNTVGGHVEGFSRQAITQFGQHLQNNTSYLDLVREAGLNNIDLTAVTGHGQTLGNFLMAHKEAFLHLSPELQRQALSFPALAPEIIASAPAAGIASVGIGSVAIGSAGLLAFAFPLGGWGRRQAEKAYDQNLAEAKTFTQARDDELRSVATSAENTARTEQERLQGETERLARGVEQKRQNEAKEKAQAREDNIGNSINELKSKDFILHNFAANFTDGRKFRVSRVVPETDDGLLFFVHTPDEETRRIAGEQIFSEIHLKTLLNRDGTLNQTDFTKPSVEFIDLRPEPPKNKPEVPEIKKIIKEFEDDPDKYIKVQLVLIPRPGGKTVSGIKLPNGLQLAVDQQSKKAINNSGFDQPNARIDVRITGYKEVGTSGKIDNISLVPKPKTPVAPVAPAAPSVPATPATPAASASPEPPPVVIVPEPSVDLGVPQDFASEGPITAGKLGEIRKYLSDFVKNPFKSEKVAIRTPGKRYYLLTIEKDGDFHGLPMDFDTGEVNVNNPIVIPVTEIVAGGYEWFLESR